jgi:AcrR family transcriptional regulator
MLVNEAGVTATPVQDAVRRMMRASGDPRAARTRQAIIDTVHELAAEGEAAPSVSDIVRRAGVSRSSFYTQFASVDELAGVILREAFMTIGTANLAMLADGGVSVAEAGLVAVGQLVAHVAEHRGLYRLGLAVAPSSHPEALAALAAQVRQAIALAVGTHGGVPAETEALYVAGGILAVLRSWIQGDLPGTVDDITNQILALLPPWAMPVSPELVFPRGTRGTKQRSYPWRRNQRLTRQSGSTGR